jgi:hypothetical protein
MKMKILQRPVLMTILFGIVCGMSFIPLNLVLGYWFLRPTTVCLTLWLFTAGYTLLLCIWSRQNWTSVTFPILFLLLTVFLVQSMAAFFFLALAGISWIRSGLCYQERRGIRLVVELFIGLAGGALVAVFTPRSALAWTLGIWLFFLLQALYFAFFGNSSPTLASHYEQEIDIFEQASRQAEEILSVPPPAASVRSNRKRNDMVYHLP